MTCACDAPGRLTEGQTAHDSGGQWHGPNGYTLLSWEVDFREDGASRVCVQSPEGRGYWVEGVHLEIAEPERVVFTGNLEIPGEATRATAGTVTFRRA